MTPALDDSYFARLESRLSTGERARLGDRLGTATAGRRPAGIGDLVGGVLDVNEIIDEANEICTRIRVFEEESRSDLPAARSPVPGADRPSVRAVGWGDLIVARERLLRYEANEIAHIENVQPGEEKRREHERILTSEDVVERETTRRTETEHDLQTTDRHEIESQANSTIEEKFSVRGGVNTSGRYGLTKVDTSLDVGFERNKTEAQSDTTKLAKEIVSKTVEKVFESVRELRRSTVSDRIREFNSHLLANPVANGVVPKPISGVYLWVEKLQEVALRHYGTRLMVEFHVPEPGLTLFSGANRVIVSAPKPAPFTLGPADVVPTNYLCLARAYGARDVEPPPTQFINVGYVWDSAPDEDTEGDKAEDTVAGTITIPDGYRPTAGEASVTALPEGTAANVDLYVAVGGREVVNVQDFSADAAWRFPGTDWPNGVPVSLLSHGHWDKALVLHVVLHCERTPEAFNRWQIHSWQKIRDAYDLLVQEYERAVLAAASAASEAAAFSSRSASTNRDLERDELKKWSVKTMRAMPFEDSLFDAVVQVGEQPEIDPVTADAQAPVVRFFEESFEWREMSYFLYPYFWGRREAWQARLELDSADPQHDAFLRAGAARVIVPVTPGYEDRVLAYLDSGPSVPELERIARPIPGTIPPDSSAEDLWLDLLTQRNEDLALGSGTLSVTSGQASITINDDSRWDATERDLGRELFIAGTRYVVAEATGPREVGLDRAYAGPTDNHAPYATGSVPFGAPWVVRIPTTLVILRENVALLNA